jgi:hypothetical protein
MVIWNQNVDLRTVAIVSCDTELSRDRTRESKERKKETPKRKPMRL